MKQYSSIDLFKLFAAIMVVAIHTHPFSASWIDYYFTSFCRIGVPFFFVATSYFFFRKSNADIKKYTKRLLLLYVIWFIIELPLVYYRFFVDFKHSFFLQLVNFVRSLIFSNTWGASWYIMASVISVNIIFSLSKKMNNKRLLCLGVGGFILSLLAGCYYGAFVQLLDNRITLLFKGFCWAFCPTNSFIVALIYVCIGKIIADNELIILNIGKKAKIQLIYGIATTIILGATEVYFMKWSVRVNDAFVFLPVLTFLLFTVLMSTKLKLTPYISKWCRNLSILIYLIHPILTFVNEQIDFMDKGVQLFVVVLSIATILSIFIIMLSQRFSVFKKLY